MYEPSLIARISSPTLLENKGLRVCIVNLPEMAYMLLFIVINSPQHLCGLNFKNNHQFRFSLFMKIISAERTRETTKMDSQKPERDFMLDKSISLKLFSECFFLNLKLGRDYRKQDARLGVSSGRRKFNTFLILMFAILTMYMVVGSIIFTLYTIKSRAGVDIFPNFHFFNF
jgi:hypothetical protein